MKAIFRAVEDRYEGQSGSVLPVPGAREGSDLETETGRVRVSKAGQGCCSPCLLRALRVLLFWSSFHRVLLFLSFTDLFMHLYFPSTSDVPVPALEGGPIMATDADSFLVVEPSWCRGAQALIAVCALAAFPPACSLARLQEEAWFEQGHQWRKQGREKDFHCRPDVCQALSPAHHGLLLVLPVTLLDSSYLSLLQTVSTLP